MDTTGFRPFMRLLPKSSASGALVQALTEMWWDTTHTFHIAEWKIIVTPHDFHQMTSLRSHGPIINMDSELGVELGIDLLGHAYPSEHVRYFALEFDFKHLSQATLEDRARMARAFSLFVWGAYLFANKGQIVSLRWLPLFCNFEDAWEVNWGHACLAKFYSVMDTLSRETLHQLVRPWKLLEVRNFFFSPYVVFQNVLCTLTKYTHAIFLANCNIDFCKPYLFFFLQIIPNLKTVFHTLANCICALSCELFLTCKLYRCFFLETVPNMQTVSVLFLFFSNGPCLMSSLLVGLM